MTQDAQVRELESAWQSSGSLEEGSAYYSLAMRLGLVTRAVVLENALGGDQAAARALGLCLSSVPRKQKWSLQQEWRRAFSRHVHLATGRWTLKGLDWHTFTWGLSLSAQPDWRRWEADKALERYSEAPGGSIWIVQWDERSPAWRLDSPQRPDLRSLRKEVFAFDTELSWTFVHAAGEGDFFAELHWDIER